MKSLKSISNVKISTIFPTILKPLLPLSSLFKSTLLTISGIVGSDAYLNGNYVASSSSNYSTSYMSYLAYNGSVSTGTTGDAWVSGNGSYSTATGQCVSTTKTTLSDTTILSGEWLDLNTPNPILLSSYSLLARNADFVSSMKNTGPTLWYIIASNTGVDGSWVLLDTQTVLSSFWHLKTVPSPFILSPTPTTAYSYYRIVVKTAGTQYSYLGIKQFNFFLV